MWILGEILREKYGKKVEFGVKIKEKPYEKWILEAKNVTKKGGI